MIRRLIILLLIVGCDNSTEPEGCSGVLDYDKNCYSTVQIGTQLWMAENLKVTHYNDGSPIPTGFNDCEWGQQEQGAYSVIPVDSSETCGDDCTDVYGNLYNWYATDDDRGICPEDYHYPNFYDWNILFEYLGRDSIAGGKMKSSGTIDSNDGFWQFPNNGTNESGFSALPAGWRQGSDNSPGAETASCDSLYSGVYWGLGEYAVFWGSYNFHNDIDTTFSQQYFIIRNNLQKIEKGFNGYYLDDGFSVRCLKD